MTTTQGTQVTLTIPEGAPPGTLLSVPVHGGADQIKVRVPAGMGAGSTLILTKPEGSEEWGMQAGTVVEAEDDGGAQAAHDVGAPNGHGHPPQAAASGSYQPVEVASPQAPLEPATAFTVRLDTTVGAIDIIVRPDWAPLGTRRFLELAHSGDLTELAFYRAIKGCIVQFGLPAKRPWPCIPDDPPTGVPFLLGAVSFAAIGEHSRRSTLFICIGDMSHMLGQKSWETPIGAVSEASLDVLESIDTTYGDIAEFGGSGPDTTRINAEGNPYLFANFPRLSYVRSAAPLDWPPLGGAAQEACGEAQQQAAQAAQAASEAARAQHAEAARQAAEAAQAAAQAAQAALKQALEACEAMKAQQAQALQQAQAAQQAQALQQAEAKKLVAVVGDAQAAAVVPGHGHLAHAVGQAAARPPATVRAAVPAAGTAPAPGAAPGAGLCAAPCALGGSQMAILPGQMPPPPQALQMAAPGACAPGACAPGAFAGGVAQLPPGAVMGGAGVPLVQPMVRPLAGGSVQFLAQPGAPGVAGVAGLVLPPGAAPGPHMAPAAQPMMALR